MAPFRVEMPADAAYYLVFPPERAARAKVRAFRDRLMDEIGAGEAQRGEAA